MLLVTRLSEGTRPRGLRMERSAGVRSAVAFGSPLNGGSSLVTCHSSLVTKRRRGVVLLVVIAMLALFASVGLSFVYYAEAEANIAAVGAQAEATKWGGPDVEPEMLLSFFLGQLMLGTDDKMDLQGNNSLLSSLRGHDLARGMYGYNRHALNVVPFNGVGRSTGTDSSMYGSAPTARTTAT